MEHSLRFGFFAVALLAGALPAAAAQDYPIKSVDLTKVKVTGGFWYDRLETNRVGTLTADFQKCNETPRIANFTNAANRAKGTFGGIPFDDSDVYKVMEGAAYILAQHPDPKLEQYMSWLIGQVAKAQERDGYLYTARTLGYDVNVGKQGGWSVEMMGPTRWSNVASSHELYNIGHMYEAAVAWYEATGRKDFLDVAVKSADLVDRTFGPGATQLKDAPGHEEIELALVKLYRTTGDRRYLDLSKHFLNSRGKWKGASARFTQSGGLETEKEMEEPGSYSQNHRPAAMQRTAVGHAVRASYLYCALADVAALTGDEQYLEAIKAIWQDVVTCKLHLNGGIGARHAGEAFGAAYELPNASAYLETCAAIGNALWNDRLFRFTGDAKYMDVVERIVYNGFLSGIALGGDEFFYPNPLASHGGYRRSKWFGCSCCPVNVVRFIPQIPRMAYATDGKDVFVNLFMNGTAELNGVKLATETDYPWNGKVKITVTPRKDGDRFALKVRVPGWARGKPVPSDLYVQTEPSAFANENGYRVFERAWKAGDTVELDFPMPVKRIRANAQVAADRGRLAVERGPILYCIEGFDNDGKAYETVLPADATFTDDTIVIGDKTFPALKASNGLKLIPYFAWDHRDPGNQMQAWPAESDEYAVGNRLGWRTSVSHCNGGDSVDALLDGSEPKNSCDHSIARYTAWEHKGCEEWLQFEPIKPVSLKGLKVYWFCDTSKGGGCNLPESWKVQVPGDDGKAWKDVAGTYPVKLDAYSEAKFDAPLDAKKFRVLFKMKERYSAGVLEVSPVVR